MPPSLIHYILRWLYSVLYTLQNISISLSVNLHVTSYSTIYLLHLINNIYSVAQINLTIYDRAISKRLMMFLYFSDYDC